MKLRTKMLLATVGVMGITAMLLVLVFTAQMWGVAREQRERHLASAARVAEALIRSSPDVLDGGEGTEGNEELLRVMQPLDVLLRDWVLARPDGRVIASSAEETPDAIEAGALVRQMGIFPPAVEVRTGKGGLLLYGNPTGEVPALSRRIVEVLQVVAVATVLLVGISYTLLSRLVLRPLDRLVAGSRSLSSGSRLVEVAGGERSDETGELVRAFNKMAKEIEDSRSELERRVEKATEDFKRAQGRLVLAQRLSATSRLAAGIAHEINNPLGGVINAVRSLHKGEMDEAQKKEYLALVSDGLERIRTIVERMLFFQRREHKVTGVDIGASLEAALAMCRSKGEKSGCSIETEVPEELPKVTGDPAELQQAFLNVALNAVQAMEKCEEARPKKLKVKAEETAGEGTPTGAAVEITFQDTGPGMAEGQLAQAFDLFYTTRDDGTGFGLAIVHTIVENHGGRISIDSNVGEGTTVRIVLPATGDPSQVKGKM